MSNLHGEDSIRDMELDRFLDSGSDLDYFDFQLNMNLLNDETPHPEDFADYLQMENCRMIKEDWDRGIFELESTEEFPPYKKMMEYLTAFYGSEILR
jgi:hypothetical protein